MSFQDFRDRHPNGSVVETDGVPKGAPFQCVDLVKQYLKEEFGIPFGSFGNAAQYWTRTSPAILGRFERAETAELRAGDITPLKGVGGNPDGHIGIATGKQDGDRFEMLEQNGSTGNGKGQGNDRIRTRWIPKSRLYGVLRLKRAADGAPSPVIGNDSGVVVEINQGPAGAKQQWNVRKGPGMGHAIRPDGKVLPGQKYSNAVIDANGWALISFRGAPGYIGPKVFTKL